MADEEGVRGRVYSERGREEKKLTWVIRLSNRKGLGALSDEKEVSRRGCHEGDVEIE